MVSYRYVGWNSYMKRSEQDIHEIFNSYAKHLYDRQLTIVEEIDSWGNDLIRQIQENVKKQKELVWKKYKRQEQDITGTREEYIKATQQHEQKGDNEQLRQLLDQCKTLKFELGASEFPEQTIPFIQFMTDGQLEQKKREENISRKAGYESSKKIPREDRNNDAAYVTSAGRNLPPKSTSTNNRETGGQISTRKSTDYDDWPTVCRDDLAEECPTCFMVFSSNISPRARTAHINGHFKNH